MFYELNIWCTTTDLKAGPPSGESVSTVAFLADLNAGQLVRLIEGRERLHSFTMSLLEDVVSEAFQGRISAGVPCAQEANKWWEAGCGRRLMDMTMRADPLAALTSMRGDLWNHSNSQGPPGACTICMVFMDSMLIAGRTYLWDKLAFLFGLDEYGEGGEGGSAVLNPYLTDHQISINPPSKCERMAGR